MNTAKRHPIALNLPKSVAPLILYGRHLILATTNNPRFPSPTPTLATLAADLDALETAEVTAKNRARGAAAARNVTKKKVEDDLMELKGYVQSVANQNADEAVAIIESAGMSPKQPSIRRKAYLSARMGPSPGEVLLRAKAARVHAAYEWQYAADGQAWIPIGTTTVAYTSIPSLTPGTTYLFRFRTTITRTTADWSQTISFMVH